MRMHLGYGPTEWDALPWHHKRMFTETLDEWIRVQSGEQPDDDVPEDVKLAAMGFRVT